MCNNKDCEMYPYYGLAPHSHDENFKTYFLDKSEWPVNFEEDENEAGVGVYSCPECIKQIKEKKYE